MWQKLNRFNSPFLWLCLLLLAGEIAAGFWIPYREAPSASETRRNPFHKRGWPEFTDGERVPGKKLVILITNSQGFGEEISDRGIFPYLLEERLNRRGIPVKIENWGMPGGTMVDHEFALLRAIQRKPDLIVMMKTYKDFSADLLDLRLDKVSMDINQLAGRPSLWAPMWNTAIRKQLTFELWSQCAFPSFSNLSRLRIHVMDLISNKLNNNFLFALHFGHERGVWTYSIEPPREHRYLKDKKDHPKDGVQRWEIEARVDGLKMYARDVQVHTRQVGIPCVWIWNPLMLAPLSADQREMADSFYSRGREILESRGITPVDLRDALPLELFYAYSHFDAQGHVLLAEKLEPLFAHELQ